MGALRGRALENNEVFCVLHFYSSKKITKYFAFCIFVNQRDEAITVLACVINFTPEIMRDTENK